MEKSHAGTAVERSRVDALNTVFMMSRLMDERYFPDVSNAVATKNEKLWREVCEKAGIHMKASENLWKIAMQHDITYDDLWSVAKPRLPDDISRAEK